MQKRAHTKKKYEQENGKARGRKMHAIWRGKFKYKWYLGDHKNHGLANIQGGRKWCQLARSVGSRKVLQFLKDAIVVVSV